MDDLVTRLRESDGYKTFIASDGQPAVKADTDLMREAADWIESWESKVSYVIDSMFTRHLQGAEITASYCRKLASGAECATCAGSGVKSWSSTAMGTGVGGQSFTVGPCPGSMRSANESDCPFVDNAQDQEVE